MNFLLNASVNDSPSGVNSVQWRWENGSLVGPYTSLSRNSGGILASRVSNFVGLFDLVKKNHNIKASELVEIIDAFPEFVF